jgi:hypothetical protein
MIDVIATYLGYNPVMDAVVEYLEIELLTEVSVVKRYKLASLDLPTSYLRATTDGYVYSMKGHKWLTSSPSTELTYCFDGNSFFTVKWSHGKPSYDGSSNELLFSEELQFPRVPGIVANVIPYLDSIFYFSRNLPTIHLVDAMAGAGKTTRVIKEHVRNEHLVINITRHGVDSYIRRCNGNNDYYRTIDSVLMHGCPEAPKLWIDEGLMAHAGAIYICMHMCKCKDVVVLGDTKQIPYVVRLPSYVISHNEIQFHSVVTDTVCYRCQQAAKGFLETFYGPVTMMSSVVGFMRVIIINSIEDVPKGDKERHWYMTYTHNEQDDLSTYLGFRTKTVHESQGHGHPSVIMVRTSRHDVSIMDDPQYVLVAGSRSMVDFTYYTINPDDELAKRIMFSKTRHKEIVYKSKVKPPMYFHVDALAPVGTRAVTETVEVLPFEPKPWYSDVLTNLLLLPSLAMSLNRRFASIHGVQQDEGSVYVDVSLVQLTYDCLYDRSPAVTQYELDEVSRIPMPEGVTFDLSKLVKPPSQGMTFLTPVLVTLVRKPSTQSVPQILYSSLKRNVVPQKLSSPVRDITDDIVSAIVDRFYETCVDTVALGVNTSTYYSNNEQALDEWARGRTAMQKGKLENDTMTKLQGTVYSASLKRDEKKLPSTKTLVNRHAANQVLAVPRPLCTASYSAIMIPIFKRIRASLKPTVIIDAGMKRTELEARIQACLRPNNDYYVYEFDVGKYDKSQDELSLYLFVSIMLREGISVTAIAKFIEEHTNTVLYFKRVGVKVKVSFQRKSGGTDTFEGNCYIIMCAVAWVFDVSKAALFLIRGDDTLIFVEKEKGRLAGRVETLSSLFNFEVKQLTYDGSVYYAGFFVDVIEGFVRLMPDPVKCILSLGREDMYCREHILEYYTSFKDNYSIYSNAVIRRRAAAQASIRYSKVFKSNVPIDIFCDFIASLLCNEEQFVSLWEGSPRDMKRRMPQSMKAALKPYHLDAEQFDAVYADLVEEIVLGYDTT